MIERGTCGFHHSDLGNGRIEKDKEAVSQIENLIEGWINPFSEHQYLISISTASMPPEDVRKYIFEAHEIGEQAYQQFKTERLESDPVVKKFHEPIKLISFFSTMDKKIVVQVNDRTIILKADPSLFGLRIIMGQSRELDMKEMLSHPLGPLPWALATPEATLRKTNKATLAAALQKYAPPADVVPNGSATIIDGMSLVQRLTNVPPIFGEVADSIFSMEVREGTESSRIHIVFDTYREESIKNTERNLRGNTTGLQFQNMTGSQIVRQWRKFLCAKNNKTSLIEFLVHEWKNSKFREKLQTIF